MTSQTYSKTLFLEATFDSNKDPKKAGVYKSTEGVGFQLYSLEYSFDNGPIQTSQEVNQEVLDALTDETIQKVSYDTQKNRIVLSRATGFQLSPKAWLDIGALGSSLGYPREFDLLMGKLGLDRVGLDIGNLRTVYNLLISKYRPQDGEAFAISEEINDRGFMVDMELVGNVLEYWSLKKQELLSRMQFITQLRNPNSIQQLKAWIEEREPFTLANLNKEIIQNILEASYIKPDTREVLEIRKQLSATSISKYEALEAMVCNDGRVRGSLVYSKAFTGRYTARGFQPQNIPRPIFDDLDNINQNIKEKNWDGLEMVYGNMSDVFVSALRTAIVAPEGKKLVVADYNAIECRVLNWLANNYQMTEAFHKGEDIYTKTAEQVGHPENRKLGKLLTLALGYGGGVNALKQFGASKLGLSDTELGALVKEWRYNNRPVQMYWYDIENAFKEVCGGMDKVYLPHGMEVFKDDEAVAVRLPSGRCLRYVYMHVDNDRLTYEGMDYTKHKWTEKQTYGGKLTENIVQAIARDCLVYALESCGLDVVLHVHDEIIAESENPEADLAKLLRVMAEPIPWADGLELKGAGFVSKYYRK